MNDKKAMIGDIGGTNTRFAIVNENGDIANVKTYKTAQFKSIDEAVNSYLNDIDIEQRPVAAAFGFAGPVVNDILKLPSANWEFSLTETGDALGFDYFTITNDFVPQAIAVPSLGEDEVCQIGGGHSIDASPIAVIGAGTGLGVSFLVPDEDNFIAVPTEGGHMMAPASTQKEQKVIDYLKKEKAYVSFQDVISSYGIENIYKALSQINSGEEELLDSVAIFEKAKSGDALAVEAFSMFFDFLGTIAGDLALAYGAFGGVYLSGGILNNPDVITMLKESGFRQRFEERGHKKEYLAEIATFAIDAENIGLRGVRDIILEYFEKNA